MEKIYFINFTVVYVNFSCSTFSLQISNIFHMIQVFHILSPQVDALVAAVAQLQANVREIQRTTTTANTAADEFDAVTISESECCIFSSCIFKLPIALVGRYLTRCWCGAPSAVLSTSRDGPSRFVTTLKNNSLPTAFVLCDSYSITDNLLHM